jgi:hypothetical protein
MNYKEILTLIIVCIFFTAKGQDNDWRLYKDSSERVVEKTSSPTADAGHINFHMDRRIARLDSLKELNPTGIEGYRVQIFFGNRDQAQSTRVEFLRDYPDVGAYISYLAPNFRLRVGDFRTKIESEKFKNELIQKYPGCYIVKDQIEFPPLQVAASND